MHWAGRASQIKDAVNFNIQRKRHIVPHQFKVRVVEQVRHVGFAAGKEVIDTQHVVAVFDEAVTEMGAKEAGAAGDEGFVGGHG